MLSTLATQPLSSTAIGKPLTEEDAQHPEVLFYAGSLVECLSENIDEHIIEFADVFEIEDESPRWDSARSILLTHLASFMLQRPVKAGEIISEHLLTGKNADRFFKRSDSPEDELSVNMLPLSQADELEALRQENARLQLQVQQLRHEKELTEASAVNALRRKPTRHNAPVYSTLDEMLTGMMKEAVAEGIREVLGDKAHVSS